MAQKSPKKILYSAISRRLRAGIKPFTEKPATDKLGTKKGKIGAADLFSLFTADIIKEDVVFTR
jgi:hypothetical protein